MRGMIGVGAAVHGIVGVGILGTPHPGLAMGKVEDGGDKRMIGGIEIPPKLTCQPRMACQRCKACCRGAKLLTTSQVSSSSRWSKTLTGARPRARHLTSSKTSSKLQLQATMRKERSRRQLRIARTSIAKPSDPTRRYQPRLQMSKLARKRK